MDLPRLIVPPGAAAARIHPVSSRSATVRLPGSKSITNRALLMAAIAHGPSVIRNALDCDDSRYMVEALRKLGVQSTEEPEGTWSVTGAGGPFAVKTGELLLGNAGTTLRFLTAALAASGGTYLVDGDRRMRERPIGDLVKAIAALGGDISAPTGSPPVKIGPRGFVGGRVDIRGSTSSQFVSALLMAAPLAPKRVEVRVTGELVSRPYIDLTLEGMRAFGAKVFADDRRADGQPVFEVVPGRGYRGRDYTVEGDASAASYFYAAAAITGSTIRVEGVGKETQQGDARAADVLAAMGCRVKKEPDVITVTGGLLKKVDWNCADIPDVVPTLAVVALFAHGRTRLFGVPHLKHKESNRIASVASELRKLGGQVKELPDGLQIDGTLGPNPTTLHEAVIDPWGDHRIAMAFAIAGLVIPGVVIREPQVVTKSFPRFFGVLSTLGARIEFVDLHGAPVEGDEAR
ncbi:MAG TPA: 3-phosphoshikimate 1-carboxyvinyltransferase [Planctomycetota bacterium]|nr:3-phosphoshikimate 1-carboxyvinyltransferase [Planctomycetota bacterium]